MATVSSATGHRSREVPALDGQQEEPGEGGRQKRDRAVSPPRGAGVEPPDPAAPRDRADGPQDLAEGHHVGRGERVPPGHDLPGLTVDHPMEEEPTASGLVADHIAQADLRSRGRPDESNVAVAEEGHHAAAAGLDPEAPAPPEDLTGQLLDRPGPDHRAGHRLRNDGTPSRGCKEANVFSRGRPGSGPAAGAATIRDSGRRTRSSRDWSGRPGRRPRARPRRGSIPWSMSRPLATAAAPGPVPACGAARWHRMRPKPGDTGSRPEQRAPAAASARPPRPTRR